MHLDNFSERDGMATPCKYWSSRIPRRISNLFFVLAYYESVLFSMFQCYKITVCNVFFNFRIDDIEDEIYREKLKIKKVSDELSDTFDDMLDNY